MSQLEKMQSKQKKIGRTQIGHQVEKLLKNLENTLDNKQATTQLKIYPELGVFFADFRNYFQIYVSNTKPSTIDQSWICCLS